MPTKKNATHGTENPSIKDPEIGLKGYSGKRKNELISALRNS